MAKILFKEVWRAEVNFVEIRPSITEMLRFFKMAAVRHLQFVWGHICTTNVKYLVGVSITLQTFA